ncbi:MAG: hypothetical protein ACI4PH_06960 [Faecousia sp.]
MFVKTLVTDNGAVRLLMIVSDCGNGDDIFLQEVSERDGISVEDILCVSIRSHD